MPTVQNIRFENDSISFILSDLRTITIPLWRIPNLQNATVQERENFTVRGHFVFWDTLEEIIGVKNLLNGTIVPAE